MKRYLAVVLAFLLSTPIAFAVQRAKDALVVDPDIHRLILENEHLRVFEARASHGATSPMHSHPPFVFISLDTARVKFGLADGKNTIFDTYPGQVLWLPDGMEHSWQLISGQVNVIAVEIKSAQKPAAKALPAVTRKANDSVAVDKDVHHVLFENDHVRVYDGRASKGRKSPMHSHPPSVIVALGRARMRLTLPDGNAVVYDLTPGQVFWYGEGMEHSWEMLSGDAHIISIEVKSAHRAVQPKAD